MNFDRREMLPDMLFGPKRASVRQKQQRMQQEMRAPNCPPHISADEMRIINANFCVVCAAHGK